MSKPNMNYNKSATDQNLTRLIMGSCDSYDESQSFLNCILYLSHEPRLYKYSINKQLDNKPKIQNNG